MKARVLTSSRAWCLVIELVGSKFGMPCLAVRHEINVKNGLKYTHSPGIEKAKSVRVVKIRGCFCTKLADSSVRREDGTCSLQERMSSVNLTGQ